MLFRGRLEEAYANLLRNQGVVTAELLKTTVSGANSVPEYLLQAGEVERERLRVRSKEINSTSTYRQSKTTQLNLRQFVESRGMRDIAFSDITGEFAESFKVFLKKELGHRNGHVNHCLCWLNRLIYIAVDREVLRANPIEDVAYEKKDAPKLRHISRSELKRMMETPMPDPMMELARRTFIFSSLTGLKLVMDRGAILCLADGFSSFFLICGPRVRVGKPGQRREDERPARQLHHRVGHRGLHHPLQFTAADMP